MKEEFISYLWKFCLVNPDQLTTIHGQRVSIIHPGSMNTDSGPDYLAAKIRIDHTLWAGNVEIHVRSSDWFRHRHQSDPAYDNIILHVVYEHDTEIRNSKGEIIPTLEIKNRFNLNLLGNYLKLKSAMTWIPCQGSISNVDAIVTAIWFERLVVERLERKTTEVLHYLNYFNHNWERTFYFLMARNFGMKVNAIPFGMLMQRTPLHILQKYRDKLLTIEALLFGQAGLLSETYRDDYPAMLHNEYLHLKNLHKIKPIDRSVWKLSRMRPAGFPAIRIAQFARLLNANGKLFDLATGTYTLSQYDEAIRVQASAYWDNHYMFDRPSPHTVKQLGNDAIRNILINTIIPTMFVYGSENMKPGLKEQAIGLLQSIPPETNQYMKKWRELGIKPINAAESQALLELKKNYCIPRKCLKCQIGHFLINS